MSWLALRKRSSRLVGPLGQDESGRMELRDIIAPSPNAQRVIVGLGIAPKLTERNCSHRREVPFLDCFSRRTSGACERTKVAEDARFELAGLLHPAVFETARLNHSLNPPLAEGVGFEPTV